MRRNPDDFDFFSAEDLFGEQPEAAPYVPGAVEQLKMGDQFTVGNSGKVYTVVREHGCYTIFCTRDDRKTMWFVVQQTSPEERDTVRVGVLLQSGDWDFKDKIASGKVRRVASGLKQNPVKVQGGRESWTYAKAVADTYAAAPMHQRAAEPAYRALAASIERIFKQILSRVSVQFVEGQPYADDKQMAQQVKKTGILYISKDFNEHPFFSPEQNLKFRAVHDWFSHLATGAEFSQRGELKAYNAQAKVTPKEALPALFTEVVGQACYATTYGDFPPQKVAILRGFDYESVGLGEAAPPITRK